MNWIFTKVVLTGMILGILVFGVCGSAITYEVGESEGYVAVRQKSGETILRTDTRISTLPPSDQALLRKGIACEDEKAVTAALENFCS